MRGVVCFVILFLVFNCGILHAQKKSDIDPAIVNMVKRTGDQYGKLERSVYEESHSEVIRFKRVELEKFKRVLEKLKEFVAETGSIEPALPVMEKEKKIYIRLALKKKESYLKRLIFMRDQYGEIIKRHSSFSGEDDTFELIKRKYVNSKRDPFLKKFMKTGVKIKKEWREVVQSIEDEFSKIVKIKDEESK